MPGISPTTAGVAAGIVGFGAVAAVKAADPPGGKVGGLKVSNMAWPVVIGGMLVGNYAKGPMAAAGWGAAVGVGLGAIYLST